ncbi:MAG: hypothetical protein Q8M83_06380 [bacterium]|nr:hypothetical protein [bacterium]
MENQNQLDEDVNLQDGFIDEREEGDVTQEVKALLLDIQKKLSQALEMMSGKKAKLSVLGSAAGAQEGRSIEGVFDGQHMVGQDGKQYLVPPNYASKSKLVEGDILKLTITGDGAFIYKQIGPIARNRATGVLERSEEGEYCVTGPEGKWKVSPASVTYFKASPGDEAVILIPQNTPSKWGALENVIKKAS